MSFFAGQPLWSTSTVEDGSFVDANSSGSVKIAAVPTERMKSARLSSMGSTSLVEVTSALLEETAVTVRSGALSGSAGTKTRRLRSHPSTGRLGTARSIHGVLFSTVPHGEFSLVGGLPAGEARGTSLTLTELNMPLRIGNGQIYALSREERSVVRVHEFFPLIKER